MTLHRRLFSLAVLTAMLFAAAAAVADSQVYVNDVRLSRGAADDLVLDFRVRQTMDQRVIDTLESGLAVRFTYWVKVQQPRRFLPDETLVDQQFERVLEKDNLADRYRLTLEEGQPPREVADLAAAVELMSRVEGLSLLPVEVLETRRPLHLRIRARLQRFELPFRLHYVLPFISYFDVGTEWYDLELPISAAVLR